MNVLSLFDGISCGQQALKELGIPVAKYYASEIEKHPIAITQHNFPDTIQLGDVTKWREWDIDWASINLLQGGSPCQGFSFAGKQLNFEDPRSKLFFEFVDILNHIRKHNPDVKFLLENVRMKKEYQDVISEQLGVQPVMINSARLSAQNRVRLYWTNICTVEQPEDKGIWLRDVLEDIEPTENLPPLTARRVGYAEKDGTIRGYQGDKKKSTVSESVYHTPSAKTTALTVANVPKCIQVGEADIKGYESKKRVCSPEGKSPALIAGVGGNLEPKVVCGAFRGRYKEDGKTEQKLEVRPDEKTNALTTVQKDNVVVRNKSKTVRSSGLGSYDKHEWDSVGDKGTELYWRKLTPMECERLQTLPDRFTALGNYNGVVKEVANSNRYRALGNGWTVEVIKHVYKNLALSSVPTNSKQ